MSYATDTVVVRLSEYETLKMMDAETQREAAMALLEQAFTGVQQTSHNVMVQMLLRMSYDNQIATLERYHSAVRSGSAGGRPETISAKQIQELTEKGLTQEQIAEKLKCSVSTVQKKQRQLGITRNNSQKPVITPVFTGVITSENLDTDTDIDKATNYAMSAMLAAVDNAGVATPQSKAAPKTDSRKKKKHLGKYRVEDYRALYCLADADLLDKISDVRQSTKYPGTRLYFVDKTPETKAALAAFLTQKELAEDVSTD